MCLTCSYSYYDSDYLENFQLSSFLDQNFSCFPKNITSSYNKKILILNSSQNHESYNNDYDSIYNSLFIGFEQENKILQKFIYSSFEFILEDGDHYMIRNNIGYIFEGLFRRSSIEIIIRPNVYFI